MSECRRIEETIRGQADPEHLRDCGDCRDAAMVQGFMQRIAAADDLSPSLPDPHVLLLKADLIRSQRAMRIEGDRTRWTGVAIWAAIAIAWLVVLTWKLGEIEQLLEKFNLVPSIPGGAMMTALVVAAFGGLVAFTVFAVAVHTVLAEL